MSPRTYVCTCSTTSGQCVHPTLHSAITTTDAAFAAARDTAEQAARREAEREADWDAWVEQALRLAGDHSLSLAVHEARALRRIEEAEDE